MLSKLIRFQFSIGPYRGGYRNRMWREWKFSIHFGRGAGYVWGRTFFVARNCKATFLDRAKRNPYLPVPWQIGFTDNGNALPYVSY